MLNLKKNDSIPSYPEFILKNPGHEAEFLK
jgi:hypothetical protein